VGGNDAPERRHAAIGRAGPQLIVLVKPEFPKTLARSAPEHRLTMLALVARMTGTMESILHLASIGRQADLAVLVRTLYDHVVVLGWLASDPEKNHALWRAEDARQRIKVHEQWGDRLAKELLRPEELKTFEKFAKQEAEGPTNLVDRAAAADLYWSERLGFKPQESPFVEAYHVIFRWASTRAHASLQGINDVVELTPDHVVVMLEPTTGKLRLAGTAIVLYALGLRVSAVVNGFPRQEDIERAMTEYKAALPAT
jgi:hypothetical protein